MKNNKALNDSTWLDGPTTTQEDFPNTNVTHIFYSAANVLLQQKWPEQIQSIKKIHQIYGHMLWQSLLSNWSIPSGFGVSVLMEYCPYAWYGHRETNLFKPEENDIHHQVFIGMHRIKDRRNPALSITHTFNISDTHLNWIHRQLQITIIWRVKEHPLSPFIALQTV